MMRHLHLKSISPTRGTIKTPRVKSQLQVTTGDIKDIKDIKTLRPTAIARMVITINTTTATMLATVLMKKIQQEKVTTSYQKELWSSAP